MRQMLESIMEQEQGGRSSSSCATLQKDLFPLPVWYVDTMCKEDQAEVTTWVKLMVVVLNYMYLQTTRPAMSEGVNEAQKEKFTSLRAAVLEVARETPKTGGGQGDAKGATFEQFSHQSQAG